MYIVNSTKKITLSQYAIEAKSFLDKSLGLLDPKKPRSLMMRTRFGIHTFGMREAIDVLVLTDDGIVVKIGKNIMPQQIFWWKPRYSRILELPAGTITKTHTEKGDHIHIE